MTWRIDQCTYGKGPKLCVDLDGSLRATPVVDPRWPDSVPYIDGETGYLGIEAACPPGLDCLKCPDPCDTPCSTDTVAMGADTVELCKGDPCGSMNTEDRFGHAITFTTSDPGPEMPLDHWHCTDCSGAAYFNEVTKRWQYCKCGPADDCPEGMEAECAAAIATWEATPDGKAVTDLPKIEYPDDTGTFAVLVSHCQPTNLPEAEWPSIQVACTGPASDPADGGPGSCCACLCNEITVTLNAGTFHLICNEGKSKAGTAICEYEDATEEDIPNIEWSTVMPYQGVINVMAGDESEAVCGWYNCTRRYEANPLYGPGMPVCDPEDETYDPTSIYCQETIDVGCTNKDGAYNHGTVIGTGTNSEIRIEAAFVTAPISGVLSNNYSGQSPQDGKNLRDFVHLILDVGCYPTDQLIPFCNCWGLIEDHIPCKNLPTDPPDPSDCNCYEGIDPNLPGTCYEAGYCTYDEDGKIASFNPRNDGSDTPTCCYCAGDITEGHIVLGSGRCAPDIVEIDCAPLVNYCGGPSSDTPTNTICDAIHTQTPPGMDVNCIDLDCAGRTFEEGVNDILISGSYYGAGKGDTKREVCVGGTCVDDPCNHVDLVHPWERCIFGGVIDTRIINRTCPDYEFAVPDGESYKCVPDPAYQITATKCVDDAAAVAYFAPSAGLVQGVKCDGGFAAGYNAICWELGGCGTDEVPMTKRTGDGPTDYECYCAPFNEPSPPGNCGNILPGSQWLELFGCKTLTAPSPCPENFSATFYSPPPGVRPDHLTEGVWRDMPYTQYPGYFWPRHSQGQQHDDYGHVCGSLACVNVECGEGEICTGLGCQTIPPIPDSFTGCCSSSSIKLSGDNTALIGIASKLVYGQADGFSGAEIACIKTMEAKMMLPAGHSESDLGVAPTEAKVRIVAGDIKPNGVTIKFKDAAGVVQSITKDVKITTRSAIHVTPTTMARLKASSPVKEPCADCDVPEKFNPPIPMTAIQKAASFAKFAVSWTLGGFKTAEKTEQQRRISLCLACDQYDRKNDKCKLCGCRMAFKTRVNDPSAKCPIGKW